MASKSWREKEFIKKSENKAENLFDYILISHPRREKSGRPVEYT
jgi:hypothetical protein